MTWERFHPNKEWAIIRRRHYYAPMTDTIELIQDPAAPTIGRDHFRGVMTFETRADARAWIAEADAERWILANNEHSRPTHSATKTGSRRYKTAFRGTFGGLKP